jgi:hypothetical protein
MSSSAPEVSTGGVASTTGGASGTTGGAAGESCGGAGVSGGAGTAGEGAESTGGSACPTGGGIGATGGDAVAPGPGTASSSAGVRKRPRYGLSVGAARPPPVLMPSSNPGLESANEIAVRHVCGRKSRGMFSNARTRRPGGNFLNSGSCVGVLSRTTTSLRFLAARKAARGDAAIDPQTTRQLANCGPHRESMSRERRLGRITTTMSSALRAASITFNTCRARSRPASATSALIPCAFRRSIVAGWSCRASPLVASALHSFDGNWSEADAAARPGTRTITPIVAARTRVTARRVACVGAASHILQGASGFGTWIPIALSSDQCLQLPSSRNGARGHRRGLLQQS